MSSSDISPTATVYKSLFFKSSCGRIKSLHGHTKDESKVYTIIGAASGKVIFIKILKFEAPSILAASSIDDGIVSKNPFCVR